MNPQRDEQACEIPPADLELFARGELRGASRRAVLEHLLRGCVSCREALAAFRDEDDDTAEDQAQNQEFLAQTLSLLSERAVRYERERTEARELLTGFLRHPTARQWTLIRNSNKCLTFAFGSRLVDAAFETNMHDPQQAYELAGMAHAIAGKLDSKSYTERIVIDLKARSMAHLANAERAMGDLRTASRLLQQAEDLRGEGSLDPLLEGEFLYLESSLLRAQRKLDKALRRVREARSRFEEFGERHWLCWALLGEATIHSFEGSVNASIELIRKADETCDAKAYPRQALAVRHNLAWSLMRAGRYQAALDSVAEFRGEYAQVGDRASLVRLAWLEANLFAAAKRLEDAGAKFDEAIRGFTELQLPYEVGSVSLDYALMLSESGRHAEVAKLAGDILGIFNALGVERETIAAWLLFRNSSEAGAVTKAMIEKVAAYFRRAKLGQPRH